MKKISSIQRKKLNQVKKKALFGFEYRKAIEFYESLLKNFQLSARDLCDLGLFYDHLSIFNQNEKKNRARNEEKALQYYHQAQKLNPSELAVFEGLGRIWWHRKDKKAIIYYQKGLEIASTPRKKSEFLEYLGNAHKRLGEPKKAIKCYQQALKMNPISKFSLFNNLAFAYQKIGQQEKARDCARKGLRLLKKRSKEYRNTKVAQIFQKQLEGVLNK